MVRGADGAVMRARRPGMHPVRIADGARTEVLFHEPLEQVVRARSRYALAFQRSGERPGLLRHAILPVDTRTRLTQLTNGWADWTDGSERIGVAIMLQHTLERGWIEEEVDEILEGWGAFARAHLLDDSAAPRRGSQQHHVGIRLYDSPWLARFFLRRHRWARHDEDLELAARILERGLELGIGRVLTIGFTEVLLDVATALEAAGQRERAERLREGLVCSAHHFVELGIDLPGHEVAYEQSMVAPLLSLLTGAYRLTGEAGLLEAIRERLPWLLAFSGPQPHARLHGIAIRHWDGYWFGQRRQWGDVFPPLLEHPHRERAAAPPRRAAHLGDRPPRRSHPAREHGELLPRRLGDLRVRDAILGGRRPGPLRGPARQRPGLPPRDLDAARGGRVCRDGVSGGAGWTGSRAAHAPLPVVTFQPQDAAA